jgi:hypothetical protein
MSEVRYNGAIVRRVWQPQRQRRLPSAAALDDVLFEMTDGSVGQHKTNARGAYFLPVLPITSGYS